MKYNFYLAFDFALRDFKERYMGTSLGQFWFILSPIIMISIYTIIFSDIMKMKLNIIESSYSYSIYLIPGILAWTNFNTVITRLSGSFAQRANIIKKINVPMHTFFLAIAITEFTIFVISIFLAVLFLVIINHPITEIFLYLLPVMFSQVLFAFSFGVILALFIPFFKDLKVVVPIIMQLWFWMTPIIYMKEIVQSKYPALLIYNPFFYYIDIYQNIFVYAQAPSLKSLVIITMLPILTLLFAIYLYKKMIDTIKDII